VSFGVFDHVRPDNLLLTRLLLVHQPVFDLLASECLVQLKSKRIPFQKIVDCVNILYLHRPQAGSRGDARQMVLGYLARLGSAGGERREANFIQLQPVQRTMIVPARADRGGQDDTASVDSLVDAIEVAATGDLLDQDRGQALGAQLLVDTEEVNLSHLDSLAADSELRRDAGNRGNQLARLRSTHADMPFLLPSRRHQGPILNQWSASPQSSCNT